MEIKVTKQSTEKNCKDNQALAVHLSDLCLGSMLPLDMSHDASNHTVLAYKFQYNNTIKKHSEINKFILPTGP